MQERRSFMIILLPPWESPDSVNMSGKSSVGGDLE